MSRTVSGTRLFDVQAKEVFRKMMWDAADFSGVEVLAYCIMTNHFHILVRVPEKQLGLTREEVLRRYQKLYAHDPSPGYLTPSELERMFAEDGEPARLWHMRLAARMGDLSEFMKTLKQRFSVWYNRNHDRYGPLWSDRFLSVLVENHPRALRTVAAYIDLNPVRAHLVEDPGEYRWTSYAEAIGGNTSAQEAYRSVLGEGSSRRPWLYLGEYRANLFQTGSIPKREGDGVTEPKKSEAIASRGGRFAWHEIVHMRVAQLARGRIFGSKGFVARTIAAQSSTAHHDLPPSENQSFPELPLADESSEKLVTACRPRSRRAPSPNSAN